MERWIGVDMGCTKMLMCAEYNGEWIDKKVPTGIDVTREYLVNQVHSFIDSLPFKPNGIGMGVCGLVENNTLIDCDQKNIEGMNASIFDREGCKCYFVNDVKAAMTCETENYKNDECIALVMVGSGIAMSVRDRSTTILGRHGWAGEIGTNKCMLNGNMEKLEDIAGGVGILNKAGCGIETFLDRLKSGDKAATDLINQAGFYFGLELMSIIHTLNPEYIIVGGSTASFKNFMEVAIETAKKYTRPTMFNDCKIVSPSDPKRIAAIGARIYGYRCENCE